MSFKNFPQRAGIIRDTVKNSPFVIPKSIVPHEHLKFCLSVIDRYRLELPKLRALTTNQALSQRKHEDEVVYWRQKYEEEKQEKERFEKEIDKLKNEIKKLTKTTKINFVRNFYKEKFVITE